MAKEITAKIKLQCPGGQATPAPPVGPALGQHGVNIAEFVKRFNDATKDQPGMVLPVEISVFSDRSFDFIIKSPPAAVLLKKAAGVLKGSGEPNINKVGTVTRAQLKEIAETKMDGLNASNIDAAINIIAGTARSMGLVVKG